MNSSGIKRGLAATAISALAITGVPLLASSASANPLADQLLAGAVVLHTPDAGGAASIKNDGANTTVHLLANGGTAVTQVRFEYSTTGLPGSWTTIATVGRTNGAFSTEWTPPGAVFNLPVHVQAVAISNVGVDGAVDDNIAMVTSNQDAIDLSEAAGSAVGVFQQPYAAANNKLLGAATATTSDVAADPAVTFSSPYNVTANAEDTAGTPANGSRTVSGPVDYTGYDFGSAVDADQAIEEANVGGATGGSDAEAVTLYQQTITTVTAAATSPSVQTGGTTSITVTVTDQNGKPVVGAEVFQDDNQDGTGDGAAQYTNSQGKAVFAAQGGSPAGTTHYFFVNTTGTVTYENGADFKRSATVTEYTAVAATITPKSADGAAFDDDEYNGADDITVTVKDQNSNGMVGQIVRYAWTVTPFEATTGYPKTLPEGSATTGAGGVASIPFPAAEPSGTYVLKTYINQDGTPGQGTGDLGGTALTVKAGQADLKWADGARAQAASNGTRTFTGKLVLEDGTALAGRNVALNWAVAGGGNAVVAAQAAQPAGTTRTGDTTATTTTGADGSFGVALTDPPATTPPGPQNETGGVLTASTTATPGIGDATDSSALTVDFVTSTAPGDEGDITVNWGVLFDEATPGRPVDFDIQVRNDSGVPLTDYPVTVSVDHGFLSPNAEDKADLTADPAPAEGGLFGEWKSDGTSKQFTTDDSGNTGTVVAIEKDAAFDTSEDVTTTVTVKAGNVTTTRTVTFTTDWTPINPGDVKIEKAAVQSVTVLPKAPTSETVNYDVFATDQFGNLLRGQSIDLTDNLAGAEMNGIDNNTGAQSNLKGDNPSLELSSDVAGAQTVTGTWTADTRTWTDGDTVAPGFQRSVKLTNDGKTSTDAGETVNWYVVDYALSKFALTHTGAATQPVGTTVTETYKAVDQNGEGIQGLDVTFFRAGPDALGDGDGNSFSTTNANGQAFYVFQGAKAGTATITGVSREDDHVGGAPTGDLIPQGGKTDVVKFGGPVAISAVLSGKSNGAKADKLKVNAPSSATGATVKLYKVVNGKAKLVGKGKLNGSGDFNFTVADQNGKKFTKYIAKVSATAKTKADPTGFKSVR
jgi:hypothetical protein